MVGGLGMSRFAAVPTAALDDERLEALHIRVLTALCSYGDKDGWCRVGQDKIAQRARTNEARVSSCISDLVKWGWVRRQRIGKKKVNVYQVLLDCELDTTIPLVEDSDGLAETASVTCPPSKTPVSDLPTQQKCFAPTASPYEHPSLTLDDDDSASAEIGFEERCREWADGFLAPTAAGIEKLERLVSQTSDAACTEADVERGIKNAVRWLRKNDQTANSFGYFEGAVLAAREQRLKPITSIERKSKKSAELSNSTELDRMLAKGRAEKARKFGNV